MQPGLHPGEFFGLLGSFSRYGYDLRFRRRLWGSPNDANSILDDACQGVAPPGRQRPVIFELGEQDIEAVEALGRVADGESLGVAESELDLGLDAAGGRKRLSVDRMGDHDEGGNDQDYSTRHGASPGCEAPPSPVPV